MTNKIVRTPTKASGGITEEEKVQLKAHADMWIKRILSTESADYSKLEPAIKGLYRVAKLAEPEVIMVKSPIMMVFMFGAASVLVEKKGANVRKVLDDLAEQMNRIPDGLTPVKHYSNVCKKLAGKKGIENAKQWSSCYQGGAYWAQYDSFLTAMRDVIGLRLPEYENYKYWEEAAIHGTFRIMQEKFCIVSDFPEVLKIDDQNRAHCQDGPSHRWRDGWSLYHWHGVAIPEEWIMKKGHLTAQMALTWVNIEQRRAACELLGWAKILEELDAKVIDEDGDPEIGTLLEVDIPDIGKERFLKVQCGTGRTFALPVPPTMNSAIEAQSWSYGIELKDFKVPEVRT
jgi:hypothetical protein